jgi:Protein of unknown function (DUF3572)
MTAPDAELLALDALTFLAGSPDDLGRFVALSGAAPADIRTRAGDPEFLAGVLDFVLGDDELAARFCRSHSIDARMLHLARSRLSPTRDNND